MNKIYTIGFTKKSAETFFGLLRKEGITTLIDVRLNNVSQLAGFTKKEDLKFFLREICGAEYIHAPELAPTGDILKAFKKHEMSWETYEKNFFNLMARRKIEHHMKEIFLKGGCLMCSEHEPHFCHRRLIIEYLNDNSDLDLKVKHLY